MRLARDHGLAVRFVSDPEDAGPHALWLAPRPDSSWTIGPVVRRPRVRLRVLGADTEPVWVPADSGLNGIELQQLGLLGSLLRQGGSALLIDRAAARIPGDRLSLQPASCPHAEWHALHRGPGAEFALRWDWLQDESTDQGLGRPGWARAVLTGELEDPTHRVGAALLARFLFGPQEAARLLGPHADAPGFADTYRAWMEWGELGACPFDAMPPHPASSLLARIAACADSASARSLLAEAAQGDDRVAEAVLRYAFAARAERWMEQVERIGAIAEDLDADCLRALALERHALHLAFSGAPERGATLAERAVELLGDDADALRCAALTTLAQCYDTSGQLERSAEAWETTVRLGDGVWGPEGVLANEIFGLRALDRSGRRDEARSRLAALRPLGARSERPLALARAEVALDQGDFGAVRGLLAVDGFPAGMMPSVAALSLRAATEREEVERGGRWTELASHDVPLPSAQLDFDVAACAHLGLGDPEELLARCEQLGDAENACRTAGLVADRAADHGAADVALDAWRVADAHAARSGVAACRERTARQGAELLLRFSADRAPEARQTLEAALAAARNRRDPHGEARAHVALAVHPDAPQAWHARRARAICAAHHYPRLGRRATTLLRLHETDVVSASPRSPLWQAVDAAAALTRADLRLDILQGRIDALPSGLQEFARRVIAPALDRLGLSLAPGLGPDVLLLDDTTGTVRLGDQELSRFKPDSVQYGLLAALAVAEPLDRDRLVPAVWGEPHRPPSSDNRLHVAVTRLRRAVAPVRIVATPQGGFALDPLPPVARIRCLLQPKAAIP